MSSPGKRLTAKPAGKKGKIYRNIIPGPFPFQPAKKKHAIPSPKAPRFYKGNVFLSILGSVLVALVILIIITVNREVGVLSERLAGTCKNVEKLQQELIEIRSEFQEIDTEIKFLKYKIDENIKARNKE